MSADQSTTTGAVVRLGRASWMRLLTLCSALLFEGMSLSGINVQTAEIRRSLGLAPPEVQLVAGSFMVSYAGFLLVGGRWADHWGPRKVFLCGVAVFGTASLSAALSNGAIQLVVARAVQGFGSAITAPAAVALITHLFEAGPARNRALGVFGATGAVGFSLGLVATGWATHSLGWRWSFAVYVPVSVLVIVLAVILIQEAQRHDGVVSWRPAVLGTVGLALVVYALGEIGTASITEVIVLGVIGMATLGGFGVSQVRSAHPLLPRALMADARLRMACVALGGAFAAISGAMLLVGNESQNAKGLSPLDVGLVFLPQGMTVMLLSLTLSKLMNRWTPQRLLLAGLMVMTVGVLLYTAALAGDSGWRLVPACLVVGIAIAAMYPAAMALATAAAAPHEQGTASGILITSQQAGAALGIASVIGVQAATTDAGGLWTAVAITVLSVVGCLCLARSGR